MSELDMAINYEVRWFMPSVGDCACRFALPEFGGRSGYGSGNGGEGFANRMTIDMSDRQLVVVASMKNVIDVVDIICAVVWACEIRNVNENHGVGGIFETGSFGVYR